MSALLESPVIAFSEEEMERITRLDHLTLRQVQPDGFGMPGHWRMNSQGVFIYSQKGAEAMVLALEAHGYLPASVCLRVKLKELTETPSLGHFAAAKKHVSAWYTQGPMA